MELFDLALIFILAISATAGMFFGLISVVGTIVTTITSIAVAGLLFKALTPTFQVYLWDNENFAKVASFIAIYWVTALFLSFVVKIVNKIFKLPVLKTVNRALGGLVSLAGSFGILGIFFYLIDKYAWIESVKNLLQQSSLVPYLITTGKYISLLIPGL